MSLIIILFSVFQAAFGLYGPDCGQPCAIDALHYSHPQPCHVPQPPAYQPCHPKPMPITVSQQPIPYVPADPLPEFDLPDPICADRHSILPGPSSGCFGNALHGGQPAEPLILHAADVTAGPSARHRCPVQIPIRIPDPSPPRDCSPAPSHCDPSSLRCYDAPNHGPPAHPHSDDECGHLCAKHYIVKCVRPVYDEYVRNVPVVQNFVRQEPVTTVKTIRAIKRKICMKPEPCHRHGPDCDDVGHCRSGRVCQKYACVVPVRSVTVPVPCGESGYSVPHSHSPICVKLKPVLRDTVVQIPVRQKCYRPVVEQRVVYVPVKTSVRKNLVEHRVQKTCAPCECI